jgi:nucleoside-diphosphate-sugar epimerase
MSLRIPARSMSYKNARVIVLGASGFVGRWVARNIPLTATSYLVVRDPNAARGLASAYNLRGTIVQLDVTDLSGIRQLFAEVQPSIVFNLAGYGVDPLERDVHLAQQINEELPRAICDFLKTHQDLKWNGQHLIQAGSALEYGIAKGILTEELKPQPTTSYGISKLAGTTAVLESSLRATAARLFNVYGPGEHSGRLLPSLIETAKTGKELSLTAGTQRRDFTYIEDVAESLVRLGLVHGKFDLPVNVATGKLHSVREFTEVAARILEIPVARLHFGALPFRQEEMNHEGVSVERLNLLLKWIPATSIESGVRKTISFLESLPEC